jgi:hypothetical protein
MTTLRAAAVVLLLLALTDPVLAQPPSKPLPEPAAMGAPFQPGILYGSVPVVRWSNPPGTYVTIYPASRPVVIVGPCGPVETLVPTAPVVAGPTWALTPVTRAYPSAYPFGASGPIYGRYSWDYPAYGGLRGW